MSYPIYDLHCDLLLYLSSDDKRTAHNRDVRCSIPQLREGNVVFQTMAVFAPTGENSVKKGMKQLEIFKRLSESYPDFTTHGNPTQIDGKINAMFAIEGASGICDEEEPLEEGLKRLEWIFENIGKPVYISLTWNTENRFGGGNLTDIGLKGDGKALLEAISGKGVAVDLSHTSDALAEGILNHIDAKNLQIRVIASHSNYRAITDVPRNLPDEFVKEIILRNGLIGVNFVRPFVSHDTIPRFSEHLRHALELGAEDHICFGADFFYTEDLETKLFEIPYFFDEYEDASSYGNVIRMWREHLGISDDLISKITHKNAIRFLGIV